MVQQEVTERFWMDYTADTLGAIMHGLSNMGKKKPERNFKLYSDYAHNARKRSVTDGMNAQDIISYITDKLEREGESA